MSHLLDHYSQVLDDLKHTGQYRQLPTPKHQGRYVCIEGRQLLNIASNDYLGLGMDASLHRQFVSHCSERDDLPKLGSTSSRLLTGNDPELEGLEEDLVAWYRHAQISKTKTSKTKVSNTQVSNTKPQTYDTPDNLDTAISALVFNSGYHANLGLIPALTQLPRRTLILADKLVHASLIDGMILSRCDFRRYRHNDHDHLRQLLAQADDYQRILIVTESIFSMDGDWADLPDLVAIKHSDARIELYVDEAHAIGAVGQYGLGVAEVTGTLGQIDYLVGTFGKTFASMGAYVLCHPTIKVWLINQMRSLIYSTALPPFTHAWTRFVLTLLPQQQEARAYLAQISSQVATAVAGLSTQTQKQEQVITSQSAIVPYILGDNARTLAKADQLTQAGFYALPIRPPTVPKHSSRIRLVMNASLEPSEVTRLIECLQA